MERQAEQMRRQQLEMSLLGQINDKHDFEVPPSIVDQVIDNLIEEMQFPNEEEKAKAKKDTKTRDDLRDRAKFQAKNTLILHKIISDEKIEVEDADVDAYVEKMLGGQLDEEKRKETIETLKKSLPPQVKENLQFTKAIDFIIENANVTEITD